MLVGLNIPPTFESTLTESKLDGYLCQHIYPIEEFTETLKSLRSVGNNMQSKI